MLSQSDGLRLTGKFSWSDGNRQIMKTSNKINRQKKCGKQKGQMQYRFCINQLKSQSTEENTLFFEKGPTIAMLFNSR